MSLKTKNPNPIPVDVAMAVQKLLTEAANLLNPYMNGLSADERRRLPKMSDKTVAFVDKTENFTISHPAFSPAILDVAAFEKNAAATRSLRLIANLLVTMQSDVSDSMTVTGSEAYLAARYYYNSVKYAARQGDESAKPIAEDLGKRYPGSTRKKPDKS